MTSDRAHFILLWMFRFMAVMSISAVGAVVMPHGWMNSIHQAIGLGEMPESPVVSYLSRSLSAFYMFFGGLVLYVSRDIPRYREFISFWAKCGLVFATITLVIDLTAGLPWWWIISEAGFLFGFFVTVIVLIRKIAV
ncbi:MAG: hypothetical protein HKN23_01740 [Verrucomicrobiales bacterium]|nr:hypothetical protein [Verrucomicrobiales bacterium]